MKGRRTWLVTAAIASALAFTAIAAERSPSADKPVGPTAVRPPLPLDSEAMNAMLRADRDKDGTLSREELEQYDMGLARRFKDVDGDRDGKLTLYEFEKLLDPEKSARK
jgi:hypothetical protein